MTDPTHPISNADTEEQAVEPAPPTEAPHRFDPWKLAAAWAHAAGVSSDAHGTPVRRSRYYTWQPIPAAEFRAQLAEHAEAAGWPTDRLRGRLDALEQAAREILRTFYRAPADAPIRTRPTDPPPTWARRGEQNALPSPLEPLSVAQVWVAEQCYTSEGRGIARILGILHTWDPDTCTWERLDGQVRDALREFIDGARYWQRGADGDVLCPFEYVTTAIVDAAEELLPWPGDRFPTDPGKVAAVDRARAAEQPPAHTYIETAGRLRYSATPNT